MSNIPHKCILPTEIYDSPINISKLVIESYIDVHRYLSKLLQQGLFSLNTLILNGFPRDSRDRSSDLTDLAQASKEGRLPQLKHLDLCGFKLTPTAFLGLFHDYCSWNELLTLDIRNNYYLDSDFLFNFMTMVQTNGLLGSLQELGIDSYSSVDTVWSCLEALYLSSCTEDELHNISDAVDQGYFPALRTICVKNFKGYDTVLVHAFNKRNIYCHKAKAPFYNPFTRFRCYCQCKPREED